MGSLVFGGGGGSEEIRTFSANVAESEEGSSVPAGRCGGLAARVEGGGSVANGFGAGC